MFKNIFNKLFIIISLFLVFFNMGCNVTENQNIEQGRTRYFLVGEPTLRHGDSFILPLAYETDIATALKIMKDDKSISNRIVLAKIEKGGLTDKYINKNLLDEKKNIWSWRVSEFLGFVDSSAEILDSWPGYIENNLDQWMHDTNGKIGFWTYTVLREVQISELH